MNRDAWKLVQEDLRHCCSYFPLECVMHVVQNAHRLMRGKYTDGSGRGCLFYLLSELLPADRRIDSRERLTRHFTGGSGEGFRELPQYQPAKYLVRLVDGDKSAAERYPGLKVMPFEFLISCLKEIIAARQAIVPVLADEPLAATSRQMPADASLAS